MKSFVLATLAGLALADDPAPKANGTPCTDNAGCGDPTTMCCVIASGGKFCKDDKCT